MSSTAAPLLTYDEQKASEAAFQGLPLDLKWSGHAQAIYLGILAITNGRDIVAGADGVVAWNQCEDAADVWTGNDASG